MLNEYPVPPSIGYSLAAKQADAPRISRNLKQMEGSFLVTNMEDAVYAVDKLMKEQIIAVDMEGVCLGAAGQATLLQIATMSADYAYLFDLMSLPGLFNATKLKYILSSSNVVKVRTSCTKPYVLFLISSFYPS